MNFKNKILESARRTIKLESKSINNLLNYLDDNFVKAVEHIYNSNGKVVITGIGKSAAIANKIVSSMNSTGTNAVFMHSREAIHGDIGIIKPNDSIIYISKSGNSDEISSLLPYLKKLKVKIIAITGNIDSYLSRFSDFVINTYVEKEACHNNLAPTSSTTAQLAIGDAITICLSELNNFNSNDFAKFHPGGSIGKKLSLDIGHIALKNEKPQVNKKALFKDVLLEISKKRLGAAIVLENGKVLGIITDGDIRRTIENKKNVFNVKAENMMTSSPIMIYEDLLATKAIDIMKKKKINHLLIKNKKEEYIGIVHILDIIKEGIE